MLGTCSDICSDAQIQPVACQISQMDNPRLQRAISVFRVYTPQYEFNTFIDAQSKYLFGYTFIFFFI